MKRIVSALFSAMMVIAIAAPTAWPADQSVGDRVDDAKITTTVKAKITGERAKNLVKVNVDTRDGVVHLKGSVPTEDDKAKVERLARDTKGVKDVTNDLRVEAAQTSPSASPRR